MRDRCSAFASTAVPRPPFSSQVRVEKRSGARQPGLPAAWLDWCGPAVEAPPVAVNKLTGLRVACFEARRAEELATLLARHGAEVGRAPALREEPLGANPEALELARRLEAGGGGVVVLPNGVGTKAPAPGCPRLGAP